MAAMAAAADQHSKNIEGDLSRRLTRTWRRVR